METEGEQQEFQMPCPESMMKIYDMANELGISEHDVDGMIDPIVKWAFTLETNRRKRTNRLAENIINAHQESKRKKLEKNDEESVKLSL